MTAGALRPGDKLVVATHNAGKLREIETLVAPFGLSVTTAGALGLPEPEETGTTFEENAALKALAAASRCRSAGARRRFRRCASTRSAASPASIRRAGPGRTKDFAAAMQRVEDQLQAAGASTPAAPHGALRRRALPRLSRRRHRVFPRRGRRAPGLAAARRQRLRLRPDVRARRLRHAPSAR